MFEWLFGESKLELRTRIAEEQNRVRYQQDRVQYYKAMALEYVSAVMRVNKGCRRLSAKVKVLRTAIKEHRDVKADDRCIEDDDALYAVLNDGIKCNRDVGSKEAMLKNCARFIENRCKGGNMPSYAELEAEIYLDGQYIKQLEDEISTLKKELLGKL